MPTTCHAAFGALSAGSAGGSRGAGADKAEPKLDDGENRDAPVAYAAAVRGAEAGVSQSDEAGAGAHEKEGAAAAADGKGDDGDMDTVMHV